MIRALALLAVLGCGSKHEERRPDPDKQEMEAKKAALFAKVKDVVNKPPVGPPKPLAPIAKLDDVAMIVTGDPKDLDLQLTHQWGVSGTNTWWQTDAYWQSSMLATLNETYVSDYREVLGDLAKVQHIVVLRPIAEKKGYARGGGYEPGWKRVQAHFYAYPSGAYEGALDYTVKNSSTLSYTGDVTGALADQIEKRIGAELVKRAGEGGPAIPSRPGYARLAGDGISLELPARYDLQDRDPKKKFFLFSAGYGAGKDLTELVNVIREKDPRPFANQADCQTMVDGFAKGVGTVKSAVLDKDGSCIGTVTTEDGDQRARFWTEGGSMYQLFCQADAKTTDIPALCDAAWSSRQLGTSPPGAQ